VREHDQLPHAEHLVLFVGHKLAQRNQHRVLERHAAVETTCVRDEHGVAARAAEASLLLEQLELLGVKLAQAAGVKGIQNTLPRRRLRWPRSSVAVAVYPG